MLFFAFALFSLSKKERVEAAELMSPEILSDIITARQSRNLTLRGHKDLTKISGQYFRKPLVNLLQGSNPSVLNFRKLLFSNFDGMVVKGESNCIAKFPDISIKDCTFTNSNQHPIHIENKRADEAEQNIFSFDF